MPNNPAHTHLNPNPPTAVFRELIEEYAAQLGIDLRFQNFGVELAQLPGCYSAPGGYRLVAFVDGEAAGCGAFRPLAEGVCEMKRLYIRPPFRGLQLGKQIAETLLDRARFAGYRAMRLDTLASMLPAVALYESLGFKQIAPYCQNPIPGCLFFEVALISP